MGHSRSAFALPSLYWVATRRGIADPAFAGHFRELDKTAVHGAAVSCRRAAGSKRFGAVAIWRPYRDLFVRNFVCGHFLGADLGTDRIVAIHAADSLPGGAWPSRSYAGLPEYYAGRSTRSTSRGALLPAAAGQ